MIQIISGEKGKGKTKILIDKANTEVKAAKGSIVYLDKSNKHMYELSNKIRLENVKDYYMRTVVNLSVLSAVSCPEIMTYNQSSWIVS
jgi:ABC-type phosphonate transport system ATPase subunit